VEGGSAEQCWLEEEEAAFIADVLQAVQKKSATVKHIITGGSHKRIASVNVHLHQPFT